LRKSFQYVAAIAVAHEAAAPRRARLKTASHLCDKTDRSEPERADDHGVGP
jgi:hypothetical protein